MTENTNVDEIRKRSLEIRLSLLQLCLSKPNITETDSVHYQVNQELYQEEYKGITGTYFIGRYRKEGEE